MKQELFLMNQNGEVSRAPIFAPLLQILLPAFAANADEVSVICSHSEAHEISGTYAKGGKIFKLAIESNFHWADVFAKVKILSGLSILPEPHQTGKIAVQLDGRVIPLVIETTENEKADTLRLTPANAP